MLNGGISITCVDPVTNASALDAGENPVVALCCMALHDRRLASVCACSCARASERETASDAESRRAGEKIFADGAKRGILGQVAPSSRQVPFEFAFLDHDFSTSTKPAAVARFGAGRASGSDEISIFARKSAYKFFRGRAIFV